MKERDPLTAEIIGGAIEVHKAMGPGLLESIYEECLQVELSLRGLTCDRQVSIPLEYRGRPLKGVYRLDLLVENEVIVEVKAVETVLPVHEAQLLSYLKLCRKKKGLLLNFNVPVLREGIIRRVN